MDRREYLSVLGGGVALLAGCTSDERPVDDSTPTTNVPTTATDMLPDDRGGESAPGDSDTPTDTVYSTLTDSAVPDKPVAIREVELITYSSYPWIEGIAENTSGRRIGYVEIDGYVYDESGVRLGQSFDNATDLPPEQKWQFKMPFLEVQAYKVSDYEIVVQEPRFE